MTKYSKIEVLEERDWILKRPTIYLGQTKPTTQVFYFSDVGEFREETYIPALHKLFEEIIENSVDEFIKTKGKFADKISVVIDGDKITVEDNGRGLEIAKHHQYNEKYIPEVIFTHLRAGSNFKDDREGIGVNGVGGSLVPIFSKEFKLLTYSNKKSFSQTYKNRLEYKSIPEIKKHDTSHGTTISFIPDFEYFGVKEWNMALIKKRIEDLAYSFPDIKFKFNRRRVYGSNYRDFVSKFSKDMVIEKNDQCALIITPDSNKEVTSAHSTVNGALTWMGGCHMDYIYNYLSAYLRPKLEKKYKVSIKPADIRNNIAIFCNLNIKNPVFSSQTKEKLIDSSEKLSKVFSGILETKLINKLYGNKEIVTKIVEDAVMAKKIKDGLAAKKKLKQIKKKKVVKLVDANSKNRKECILHLTEGDSASSMANTIRDPMRHAFLPLRGKVLNVYELNKIKVLSNSEIQDILNSTGLNIYDSDISNIRYGKIVLLSDQDFDGFSIRGLLINFFYKYWPDLFRQGIISFLQTPLFKVIKGKQVKYFYSNKDLEENKKDLEGWKIKYYKGLGSMTKDDWNYCLNTHTEYETIVPDNKSSENIKMAFSKDTSLRKLWLQK